MKNLDNDLWVVCLAASAQQPFCWRFPKRYTSLRYLSAPCFRSVAVEKLVFVAPLGRTFNRSLLLVARSIVLHSYAAAIVPAITAVQILGLKRRRLGCFRRASPKYFTFRYVFLPSLPSLDRPMKTPQERNKTIYSSPNCTKTHYFRPCSPLGGWNGWAGGLVSRSCG